MQSPSVGSSEAVIDGLLDLGELKVRGLSRVLYSSVKTVRDIYVSLARNIWRPEVNVTASGTLEIEGYRFSFYQVKPDVEGGRGRDDRGNFFWVRGGNGLEKVQLLPLVDILGRKIALLVLEFRGEEHPNPIFDKMYKGFRLAAFFKLKDVEAMAIELHRDKARIVFPRICSGEKTYASSIGVHKNCMVETASTNINIYVSNVWNHAMATWNTNPSLPLVKMAPKVTVGLFKRRGLPSSL
uniref:Uncharacterized protein n=1 Tax=Fervidicoccus fontis TaxID=683846 RepID=A0A7J3ZL14_9CREN